MDRPPSDCFDGGLAAYARRLRSGELSAETAVEACLSRIATLQPTLNAFEYVAADTAMAAARAVDKALAAGIDLGPLMGLPVAVKDLLAVDGMPVRAGSNLDVTDLIGDEGSFVRRMRQTGCIFVGKTHTVEFALGGAGTNRVRGTPRNPCDAQVPRAPGGSSSGSAVIAASRGCPVAIGSDTGGSVRGPAAFCGAFGLKTSKGLWPTDGVYPLSPTLDTLGLLTATAADAAWFFAGYQGSAPVKPAPPRGLRLGRPTNHFFEDLEAPVARCAAAALAALAEAGVEIVDIEVPEAGMDLPYFYDLIVCEFIAVQGRDRFVQGRDLMDPDVARWGSTGLEMTAERYIQAAQRQKLMSRLAVERFEGLDGILAPTRPLTAPPLTAFDDPDERARLTPLMARNTRYGNMSALCATSAPIHQFGSEHPVGLSLMAPAGHDARLMAMALTMEEILGTAPESPIHA